MPLKSQPEQIGTWGPYAQNHAQILVNDFLEKAKKLYFPTESGLFPHSAGVFSNDGILFPAWSGKHAPVFLLAVSNTSADYSCQWENSPGWDRSCPACTFSAHGRGRRGGVVWKPFTRGPLIYLEWGGGRDSFRVFRAKL